MRNNRLHRAIHPKATMSRLPKSIGLGPRFLAIAAILLGLLGFWPLAASAIITIQSPVIAGPNVTTPYEELAVAVGPFGSTIAGRLAYAYVAVTGGKSRIYVTYETAAGSSVFATPVKVSNGLGDDRAPSVALSAAGGIYVTWSGVDSAGVKQIFYARLDANLAITRGPIQLTKGYQIDSDQPRIAVVAAGSRHFPYIAYRGPNPTYQYSNPLNIYLLKPDLNGNLLPPEQYTVNLESYRNLSDPSGASPSNQSEQYPDIALIPETGVSGQSFGVRGAVVWEDADNQQIKCSWIISTSVAPGSGPPPIGHSDPQVVIPSANQTTVGGARPSFDIQPMPVAFTDAFVGHLAFVNPASQEVYYAQFSPYLNNATIRAQSLGLGQSLYSGRPSIVVDPGNANGSTSLASVRRVHIGIFQGASARIYLTRNNGYIYEGFGFTTLGTSINHPWVDIKFTDSGTVRASAGSLSADGPKFIALTKEKSSDETSYRLRVGYFLNSISRLDYVLASESGLAAPSPTPTISPTPSPSPSPSPSPTRSPTPTPTPSPSPSPTRSPTPSPSPSLTASWTPTPSPSPSPSKTRTPTPTPSHTPTPSPTRTPTPTPSPSPLPSATPSPLPTPSPTPTTVFPAELIRGLLGAGPLDPARQPDVNSDGVTDIADLIELLNAK